MFVANVADTQIWKKVRTSCMNYELLACRCFCIKDVFNNPRVKVVEEIKLKFLRYSMVMKILMEICH